MLDRQMMNTYLYLNYLPTVSSTGLLCYAYDRITRDGEDKSSFYLRAFLLGRHAVVQSGK